MNKKILLLLALVLSLAFGLSAQKYSGNWSLYPTIGRSIDKLVDTGSKVYFITGDNLYYYSESDHETFSFSESGSLSDVGISNIFFDHATKKLLIAYTNSNIDILSEDGSIVNVPAVRDALLTSSKTIRDASFVDNKAYLITDFGLVVVDMHTGNIQQSGIYGFAPDLVLATDNWLVLYFKTAVATGVKANTFYLAPRTAKLSSFSAFTEAFTEPYSTITAVDDTHFIGISNDYWRTRVLTIDSEAKTIASDGWLLNTVYFSNEIGADGNIYAVGQNDCRKFDKTTLKYTDSYPVPAEIAAVNAVRLTTPFAFGKKGASTTWIGSKNGLAEYDLATSTQLMAPYFPQGVSVRYPHLMRWGSDGKLWVSNRCATYIYPNVDDNVDGLYTEKFVCTIEGDRIVDRTPTTDITGFTISIGPPDGTLRFREPTPDELARFQAEGWNTQWPQMVKDDKLQTKHVAGGANILQPDPDNPELFWIACAGEGLYLCKKGEGWSEENRIGDAVALYSRINFPYPGTDKVWTRGYGVEIDPEGNLWLAFRLNHAGIGPDVPFIIMPADVRKKRPEDVKYEDWIVHPMGGTETIHADVVVVFCKKSNMMFYGSANYGQPLFAVDTKGTYTDPSDDVCVSHSNIIDQDGNSFGVLHYTALAEDMNGQVWVGSTEGLFVIPNPQDAASENMRVRRPVVPRNDGTNFGDYLLDGANISNIVVDPTNRKWVSTFDAGVYLVNADGTKVISHFTKDNSPLVSDVVYTVACDPNSNRVYFGTDAGVMSYDSDASPAQPDYSDVYVYPNPVRPEYNGWITIAGLMDDSLVKIADMSGNVVFQGRSSGGTFIWDGCNSAGERVRTGVYLVLASTGAAADTSSAVVSKIMIMN